MIRVAEKLTFIRRASSSTIPAHVKVFDRETKRRQRNWAANANEFDKANALRKECGYRIADRVFDLTKFNEVCIDLGSGAGYIAPHLIKENVGVVIQCDMSEEMIKKADQAPRLEVSSLLADKFEFFQFPVHNVVANEELVPFRSESADLIVSSLAAHWINDLPGWFRRCIKVLRPDAAMIGSMLAGDSLHELRVSIQLAEMERLGGIGAHISPFVKSQDIGSLMNRAGFSMITLDLEDIEVKLYFD